MFFFYLHFKTHFYFKLDSGNVVALKIRVPTPFILFFCYCYCCCINKGFWSLFTESSAKQSLFNYLTSQLVTGHLVFLTQNVSSQTLTRMYVLSSIFGGFVYRWYTMTYPLIYALMESQYLQEIICVPSECFLSTLPNRHIEVVFHISRIFAHFS